MKYFNYIFQGALIFIVLASIAWIILSIVPFKEYDFEEQPYPVINKTLHVGDSLQIKVNYCKKTNAAGDITQIWEGPSRVIINAGTYQSNKGCINTILTVPVPASLSPGTYVLHNHGEYPKYLVGKSKVDTFTERFEIIK